MTQNVPLRPHPTAALSANSLDDADADTDTDTDINSTRSRALLTFSTENIQRLDGIALAEVQGMLRHGPSLGVWTTPREWVSPGLGSTLLTIDLRSRIIHFLPEHLQREAVDGDSLGLASGASLIENLQLAVLTLSRYLVLLRIGPTGMGRKCSNRSLSPTSILHIAYSYGAGLLATAVAKRVGRATQNIDSMSDLGGCPTQEVRLLGGLSRADFSNLTPSARKYVLAECDRMIMLSDRALWWDLPSSEAPLRSVAMKGPARDNEPQAVRLPHLPLPDEYVAQMGSRSLWLMRNLGPNVLSIALKLTELWTDSNSTGRAAIPVRDLRREGVRAILKAHAWRTQEGVPFSIPPFPLRLPRLLGFGSGDTPVDYDRDAPRWPPRSYRDFIGLLGILQTAHFFIVNLSMGARQSEMLSLQRDCVSYEVDGRSYADGRTYKLVQRHEGEWRDWQLPDVAVEAIEQQVRLVSLGEQLAYLNPDAKSKSAPLTASGSVSTHLWAQFSGASVSDATEPLRGINQALIGFAGALCMDAAPSGQNLRSHRFRKTLARLVALALTQAPKLLMEVFGHKSIEMTLYYILTDKDLRSEIETVSRELRVMRAKEVVERMVEADLAGKGKDDGNLGGYGGLGAVSVMSAIGVHRERVHRRGEQWGAKDVLELAELLTLQGTAWEQVRPGVLCTKFPGEAGPCNKSKGRPEPSKCKSSCGHRLEEAFLREDVDGSIRESLEAYEQALADDEMLTSAHWAAQVRAHVPRFPELREKWMQNATVQALMGSEHGAVIA